MVWMANLTWVRVGLLIATFAVMSTRSSSPAPALTLNASSPVPQDEAVDLTRLERTCLPGP